MKHLALFFLADSVVNLAHHGASMPTEPFAGVGKRPLVELPLVP